MFDLDFRICAQTATQFMINCDKNSKQTSFRMRYLIYTTSGSVPADQFELLAPTSIRLISVVDVAELARLYCKGKCDKMFPFS